MQYEFLQSYTLDINFGDFSKCENEWEVINEEDINKILDAALSVLKDEKYSWQNAKEILESGKVINTGIGCIRVINDTEKCKLCGGCMEAPALSRRDNRTYICSDCGEREAFEDYYNERI